VSALRDCWARGREATARTTWPTADPASPATSAVVVSFNTRELVAALLLTLHRVLPTGALERVVVVDNGSTDGSAELLQALDDDGLVQLVRSSGPPYHGPGLNRGVSALAAARASGELAGDRVWVLDSDVIVLRQDALEAPGRVMTGTGAALVGQLRHGGDGYTLISSHLLDARQVWRRGVAPFWDHGDPGVGLQASLDRRGALRADFPYYRDGYVLHRGRATIRSVAERGLTDNKWYAAGLARGEPHFHGHPDGEAVWSAVTQRLLEEAPGLEPAALAAALRRPDRLDPLTLPRPTTTTTTTTEPT
jgi:glycosyltransferase involved in cell wall biosynthesis